MLDLLNPLLQSRSILPFFDYNNILLNKTKFSKGFEI